MIGFLLIDKPAGITSHDVIARLRRITGVKRIGHAGTLDPFATGLLLVGVGREATREMQKLVGLDKRYEATFVLGASSDTDDVTGMITQPLSPTLPLSGEGALIADVAASFQQAVVDSLVDKTLAAVSKFQPRSVILSGGVSANHAIRTTLRDKLADQFPDITFHAPDLSLTGDNAVMIAIAGLFRAKKKQFVDPLTLEANPNMKLV